MRSTVPLLLLLLLLLLLSNLVSGCFELVHKKREECPHWTYSNSSLWGDLCDAYSNCKNGTQQSPIDISSINYESTFNPTNLVIVPHYLAEHGATFMNNGHTLVISNFTDTCTLKLQDGSTYNLLQFHFHSHSEHTVEGKSFPLELHLVHQDAQGNMAVLGFLYQVGEESNLLSDLIGKLEGVEKIDEATIVPLVELQNLITSPFSFYHYTGSLTTPPCSESVKWFISKTVLSGTEDQINSITKIMGFNYRPIQLRNNRPISSYDLNVPEDDINNAKTLNPVVITIIVMVSIFVMLF